MFPFQICIFKQRPRGNINTSLRFFITHSQYKVNLHRAFASFKVWSTVHSASSFCTHAHSFSFKGSVGACELTGSRGDKGIMMQVLKKQSFPQGRRVEDCGFNKRGKKSLPASRKLKKKIKVQHVHLRCFEKEVFTTFEENLAFGIL